MTVPDSDIKTAMDAGGWKSFKLFFKTYVHTHEAGKNLIEKLEKQNTIDSRKKN